MKGPLVLALVFLLVTPLALYAQDSPSLGRGDIAFKFGYVVFPDGTFEDDGLSWGLEGYSSVASNVYVGAGVAFAGNIGPFSDEMMLIPIEVNAKYAFGFGSHFVLAGGAGLCLAYAELESYKLFFNDETYNEWLFGGQIFGDLLLRFGGFDFGLNVKYQPLEEFDQAEVDFSNIRLGIQVGLIF